MATDADLTRAIDRLRGASINHARARGKLDRAELERARAVVDARAAGLSSREIGAVLGISHVHVLHLARGVTGDTRPDPSATGRGAPEPTFEEIFPPSLAVISPRTGPDPSATVCRRAGCRDLAMAGSRFCLPHSRY